MLFMSTTADSMFSKIHKFIILKIYLSVSRSLLDFEFSRSMGWFGSSAPEQKKKNYDESMGTVF
jgi:hypothetical protein